jgi:hypothetical protein
MSQFPAMEAKVSYDHLTFRATVDVLKAETPLDWNEFWTRVRDEQAMTRVAQAMLRAAAVELCQSPIEDNEDNHPALGAKQSDALIAEGTVAPSLMEKGRKATRNHNREFSDGDSS